MARLIDIVPTKTYATEANAVKAVEKVLGDRFPDLRYFVMKATCEDHKHNGRFFPVFVGIKACEAGIHFHFNVIN